MKVSMLHVILFILNFLLDMEQPSFITWYELMDAIPTLTSTQLSCIDLEETTFKTHSGKLVGINTTRILHNIDDSLQKYKSGRSIFWCSYSK